MTSRHVMSSCHVVMSCRHVMSCHVTLETLVCVTVNIHPSMSKTRIPASVNISLSSKSGSKTPKSDQAKCHAPFSSREHVGSIMSKMSFHDVTSCHVIMSCRHVMSSCHVMSCHVRDPCVCHCQYSPIHVKDQNPCLCEHLALVKVWLENAQIRPSKVPRPLFIPRACR